jgi:hypothetical protein
MPSGQEAHRLDQDKRSHLLRSESGDTRELGAAVTALGAGGRLLHILVRETTSRGLDTVREQKVIESLEVDAFNTQF